MDWADVRKQVESYPVFMARGELSIDLATISEALAGNIFHPGNLDESLENSLKAARVVAPDQVGSEMAKMIFDDMIKANRLRWANKQLLDQE